MEEFFTLLQIFDHGVTNLCSHTDCALFTLSLLLSVSVTDKCESVTALFLLHNFFTLLFLSKEKTGPVFPTGSIYLTDRELEEVDKVAEKYSAPMGALSN